MSAGPIPISEVAAYMGIFGPHGVDDREDFVYLIRACDAEWMSTQNARQSQEARAAKSRGKR